MKRIVCIMMLLGLISCLTFGQSSVGVIPFSYDPNKVVGTLIGSRTQVVGVAGETTGDASDDENDPITIRCIGGLPTGMVFSQPDGTHWKIQGTPTVVGTYYIQLEVGDAEHPLGTHLTNKYTVLWFVLKKNASPILKGCGSSYVR